MLRKDHVKFASMLDLHKAECRNRKVRFLGKYSEVETLASSTYLHFCLGCKHEWESTISNFVKKTGCPKCAMRRFQEAGLKASLKVKFKQICSLTIEIRKIRRKSIFIRTLI